LKKLLQVLFLLFSLVGTHAIKAQEVGLASFYHAYFNGKKTASGELYNDKKFTCAHKTLPLGTLIKVTNLDNDKSVVVRVNDRGPYVRTRILDLSLSAAKQLGYVSNGTARVSYEIVSSDNESAPQDSTKYSEPDKFYQITPTDTSTHLTYGIKIGSYEDAAFAFKISNDLRQRNNATVYVQTAKLVKGYLYRVFVGNFNSAEEAEELKRTIKKQYSDAYVIKYDNFK
jgi:rare lipoprotein A